MSLTHKDIELIKEALKPEFEDLRKEINNSELRTKDLVMEVESRLTGRMDQLEKDVKKAIVDDLMATADDHEVRIGKLEKVVVAN